MFQQLQLYHWAISDLDVVVLVLAVGLKLRQLTPMFSRSTSMPMT